MQNNVKDLIKSNCVIRTFRNDRDISLLGSRSYSDTNIRNSTPHMKSPWIWTLTCIYGNPSRGSFPVGCGTLPGRHKPQTNDRKRKITWEMKGSSEQFFPVIALSKTSISQEILKSKEFAILSVKQGRAKIKVMWRSVTTASSFIHIWTKYKQLRSWLLCRRSHLHENHGKEGIWALYSGLLQVQLGKAQEGAKGRGNGTERQFTFS